MSNALVVHFSGAMPPDRLAALRESLNLHPRGRLTDAEDANFGYRQLQHDDENWITLDLWRQSDTEWSLDLTYLKTPPAAETLDETLSSIRGAVTELGFTIGRVDR